MIYKKIDNELHVAYTIILSNYESKLFDEFDKQKSLSLAQICTLLRLDLFTAKRVVRNLAEKINFKWQITVRKANDNYIYYRLKEKD